MHLSSDDSFAIDFVAAWKSAGVVIDCDPKMVAGLIRALFFVSLHEEEFGKDVYPGVLDVLIDLIAHHLVTRTSQK